VQGGSSALNVQFREFAAVPLSAPLVNTSGAGDTLVGGCVAQLAARCTSSSAAAGSTQQQKPVDTSVDALALAVECGLRAAALKVVQAASVSPLITPNSVKLVLAS
jgi:sugar/nucleoside kinase (ribokinase family)